MKSQSSQCYQYTLEQGSFKNIEGSGSLKFKRTGDCSLRRTTKQYTKQLEHLFLVKNALYTVKNQLDMCVVKEVQ